MTYHAVIFDLRGTLLRDPEPHFTLNATMMQARSLGVDPIRFASAWYHHAHQTAADIELPWIESNLQAVCEDLKITLDPTLRRRLADQREQVIRKSLTARRGAVRMLTRLRASGVRTAVVGDVPPDVRLMLQQTELAKHLDVELLSTSGACRHTDPRVLRHTIDALGLPAKTCLYVSAGGLDELDTADRYGLQPVAFRADDEGKACQYPAYRSAYPCVCTMIEVYWLVKEAEALTA
ncbi:MAG: HAD family hydrolase [Phycisphaeraceae bacterium]